MSARLSSLPAAYNLTTSSIRTGRRVSMLV
jgi:hypothetical protein